ncbi:MAG: FAD-dependent oxidoreductase [Puniceicoccales bacterium]
MHINTDCLIIGGGPAGYAAAWAAAHMGVKTVIAERYGFLGGMGTVAGLNSFLNHHYEDKEDLSDGVYRRLVRRLYQAGSMYRAWEPNVDVFGLEDLKSTMEVSLTEEGVRILYHCAFDTIRRSEKGHTLRFVGKGDEVFVDAQYVIDTTGDADVCAKAGVPVSYGNNGARDMAQPMSMIVQLAGFNPSAYAAAGFRLGASGHACQGDCWREEIHAAREAGEWSIPRDSIAMWWSSSKDSTHIFINGTRVQGLLGCDPEQLSQAEMEGRRQARELAMFFRKYVPGFEHAYLLATGPQIGVRETRRIVGNYVLTKDDVFNGYHPDDTVAECAYPIDIHAAQGLATNVYKDRSIRYGIPYRCLVAKGANNMLAAGRCISADHQAAGSFRVMPTCMSLGEAAGTAVGIAAQEKTSLENLNGAAVRHVMDTRRGNALTDPGTGVFTP